MRKIAVALLYLVSLNFNCFGYFMDADKVLATQTQLMITFKQPIGWLYRRATMKSQQIGWAKSLRSTLCGSLWVFYLNFCSNMFHWVENISKCCFQMKCHRLHRFHSDTKLKNEQINVKSGQTHWKNEYHNGVLDSLCMIRFYFGVVANISKGVWCEIW